MVLLVLALGACGGDDGDGSSTTTTGGPTTTIVAPSTAPSSTSSSTSVPGSTSTTTLPGGGLSTASRVELRGVGPVRIGMTLDEATAAAGKKIVARSGSTDECGFADPEGGPEGVSFMVLAGRIARVDVAGGPVRTLSDAGVGDTEADVQARYSNRLEVTPHKYLPGHFLTLVPSDPADADFRLIFETDGNKVTRYRSGKQPEASYVEGCG